MSVSIPRICPHEGSFEVQHGVGPTVIWCSTLQPCAAFCPVPASPAPAARAPSCATHLVPLGVTRVSAGVSTAVGGRATADLHNPGQFEITDHRSLDEMMDSLVRLGYQPVLKDWEHPVAV